MFMVWITWFLWLFYKKRQKTILFGEAPRENYPEDFNLKAPLTIFFTTLTEDAIFLTVIFYSPTSWALFQYYSGNALRLLKTLFSY